jgi:hypothetical protein
MSMWSQSHFTITGKITDDYVQLPGSLPENAHPTGDRLGAREPETRTLAGRVEDWRGIPKAEPIRFSPFPLGVPQ